MELALAQELDQISQMEMQLEHEKLQVFFNFNSIKFKMISTFLGFSFLRLLKDDVKSLAIFRSDKKAVDSRNKMLQRNKVNETYFKGVHGFS